jgi:hypothetical protein
MLSIGRIPLNLYIGQGGDYDWHLLVLGFRILLRP